MAITMKQQVEATRKYDRLAREAFEHMKAADQAIRVSYALTLMYHAGNRIEATDEERRAAVVQHKAELAVIRGAYQRRLDEIAAECYGTANHA